MNLANTSNEEQGSDADLSNIVIRSYTVVGNIQGLGFVEVEARETVMPDQHQVGHFVRFGLTASGDYPQTAAALVQYDNIDRLMKAMERLSTASIQTNRFSFSEIETEVDDLKIIVFNDAKGKLMFVVSTGGVSVHFNSLERLPALRDLVRRCKQHLDQHKFDF